MPAAVHDYIEFIRDLPEHEQVAVLALVVSGVPIEKAVAQVIQEGYGR